MCETGKSKHTTDTLKDTLTNGGGTILELMWWNVSQVPGCRLDKYLFVFVHNKTQKTNRKRKRSRKALDQ